MVWKTRQCQLNSISIFGFIFPVYHHWTHNKNTPIFSLIEDIRDLKLSKKQAELLGSRLKGWNLLREDTKVWFYRGRHEEFKDFFSQEDGVVFCNDVCSVMEVLGHEFIPDQWRLFIDSSKVSLKLVLLHNGKKNFPPFLWLMQPTWRKVMETWS